MSPLASHTATLTNLDSQEWGTVTSQFNYFLLTFLKSQKQANEYHIQDYLGLSITEFCLQKCLNLTPILLKKICILLVFFICQDFPPLKFIYVLRMCQPLS